MKTRHVASRLSFLRCGSLALGVLGAALGACGSDAKGAQDAVETSTPDTAATETTEIVATETGVTETNVDETGLAETVAEVADTAVAETGDSSDPNTGVAIVDLSTPVDLTPEGAFAIFWDQNSAAGDTYLYRVGLGTLALETSVGNPQRDFPTGLSRDLRITALYGEPVQAAVWAGDNGWHRLGSLYPNGCGEDPSDAKLGDIGGAWDISGDGEIVVGMLWKDCDAVAFRWSKQSGGEDFRALDTLGAMPDGSLHLPINRATVISDDGKVAAGFAQTTLCDRWPAIWKTGAGTGELLETDVFPADAPGEILALDDDGNFAAGIWNQHGFVWSPSGGVVDIGALPEVLPGDSTWANAVSELGSFVFGASGGPLLGTPAAFVWTPTKGMRRLQDVAAAHGVTLPEGMVMTNVLAAAQDGTVVIGTVTDTTFAQKSFVLRLPATAYTD